MRWRSGMYCAHGESIVNAGFAALLVVVSLASPWRERKNK
jgi:hypothetical protein